MNKYLILTKDQLTDSVPDSVSSRYPRYDDDFNLITPTWQELIDKKVFCYVIYGENFNAKGVSNSQKKVLIKGDFDLAEAISEMELDKFPFQ